MPPKSSRAKVIYESKARPALILDHIKRHAMPVYEVTAVLEKELERVHSLYKCKFA